MAETVSWDGLRELAEFKAEKGCAISLYVDLDPSTAPTAGDVATRISALLNDGERHSEENNRGLTHDQRLGLKEDFERIREWFGNEFQRDGAHGLAVFSAGLDNVWRPRALIESVPDRVRVGREFHLAPLVPLVGRGEGALVAFVGRERGDLFRLRAGRLEEIVDHTDEVPGRHDQGGWSQGRFQRHIEKLVSEHLKEVAEEIDRRVRRMASPNGPSVPLRTDRRNHQMESATAPRMSSHPSGVGARSTPRKVFRSVPKIRAWKLSRPTKSMAIEPCLNTRFETASTSDATSGKMDSTRMTRTAGQMNSQRAMASERSAPRGRFPRCAGSTPEAGPARSDPRGSTGERQRSTVRLAL